MAYVYETLEINYDKGVLTATINNPPVNVMTLALYMDLVGFTSEVEQDESVKVVYFRVRTRISLLPISMWKPFLSLRLIRLLRSVRSSQTFTSCANE